MGVNTDASHTGLTEVETTFFLVRRGEAGLLEKCDNERSQATINMKGDFVLRSKARQGRNIIDNAVGEVGSRSNKKNGVGVDQATDCVDIDLELGLRAGHTVQFDLEIIAGLDESRVGCIRNNPMANEQLHVYIHFKDKIETHISGSVTPRS
jgi:hypothetical protein